MCWTLSLGISTTVFFVQILLSQLFAFLEVEAKWNTQVHTGKHTYNMLVM